MPEVNITELVATTLRNRSPITADNISNNNALLSRLRQRGNVRTADGGRVITQPLIHAELGNFMWYSGYETLNLSPNPVVDAAEYDWKQAAVNVVYSGLEIRVQNAGSEKQIDLLEARMQAAEITMANQMSQSIYSDGTGSGGKEITGLQAAVALNPTTGTYGGINRATYTFWRNQTSGDVTGLDTSAALLESEMRDMWLECTVGVQKPDLIVADKTLFNLFWSSLSDIQRISNPNQGVYGFQSLKFVTADVVYDGDSGIRANTMYFLNTDSLFFRPHVNTNFTALETKSAVNQDASVVPMVFAGNLCSNNARLNGVIYT
jgi:hypothetical protein